MALVPSLSGLALVCQSIGPSWEVFPISCWTVFETCSAVFCSCCLDIFTSGFSIALLHGYMQVLEFASVHAAFAPQSTSIARHQPCSRLIQKRCLLVYLTCLQLHLMPMTVTILCPLPFRIKAPAASMYA